MNFKPYIHLSHNDLDGIGCNIVLREKFPDMTTFHVGYSDIKETLQIISDDINHLTKVLFVTDLSFSREDFNELMNIAERNPDLKIVYVDHHEYDDDAQEYFEEMKAMINVFTIHRIGTSATKLCLEITKSANQDLIKLVTWIDAYDIFKQHTDPDNFKIGWVLNTIFWEIKMSGFKSNILNNDYKIPKMFKLMYKDIVIEKDAYFKKLIDNGLVVFDDHNSILLSFSDKYKSFWQMDFPDYEFYVLPSTKSNNISVRINDIVEEEWCGLIKESILNYCNKNPWVISSGGHKRAFGITIDKDMPKDDHMTFIQGLVEVLESYNASERIPF